MSWCWRCFKLSHPTLRLSRRAFRKVRTCIQRYTVHTEHNGSCNYVMHVCMYYTTCIIEHVNLWTKSNEPTYSKCTHITYYPITFTPTPTCTGALIYLLNLFCNSQNPTVREETASLFAKMITDKLVGPKVRIVLSKFLPLIFMDAMRDNPEASVHMFESE